VAFAVWLGVLWVAMIAGFGLDIPRYLHENPPAPKVTLLHGAVFTGWMLIVTAQVLLVLKDRVAWHRKFGWFAAGWACLMAVMGPWAALASVTVNLNTPFEDTASLGPNLVDIAGFVLLLAWGIALRRNPAAHKRMMILATFALADPAFARISLWLRPQPTGTVLGLFFLTYYGNLLLLALMIGWDWWRGRLMPQLVAGAAALLGAQYLSTLLYFWGPWKALSHHWVEAWVKLAG
jgi:hypothetical protein